ncbi:MAG: ABC transporter substrate-binding protein [Xanthobacteraceae bacterium]|jgi:putative ABC transport system substrate-binding protein
MRRREFIASVGSTAVAWPLMARAQQGRVRRIGVLMARAANDPEGQKQAAALERGIKELGWSPGRNVEIEYRWAAGDASRAEALAKELLDWRPDILVANSTPSLVAARQATSTIPIVFVAVADPVAQGFVQSLARPGGNITGFGAEEPTMGAKWLQLLSEMAPRLKSITVIFNPDSAPFARMFLPAMEAVRATSAFELIVSPVRDEIELGRAIAMAGRRQSGGLISLPDIFLNSRREMIVALTAKQHLPAIYAVSDFTRSGGLIAYGIERADLFRRSAAYVDRILKGEKAADLAVQQPSKFELVINLKTAKTLGLTVPPTLLARADEVIE